MKGEFLGKLTLGAVTSGSLSAMLYLINSTKKNKEKRRGYDVDGYDVDGYDVDAYNDEEVVDDNLSANTTPDRNYYMDAPIKDKPNRIQPGNVSSTVVNSRDYNTELIICDLDDMVYSSLTVEIPPTKYKNIGDYEVYDDNENIEDYFE
jgi:hypothetical protein